MKVVIGLGGNALLRRGDPLDAQVQRRNARSAVASLIPIIREHTVLLTHGNGPQVGLLALQNEAYRGTKPFPLDVLGAETQGMIGYEIESALRSALPGRDVATVVTFVEVDARDPAFDSPGKPVGPLYSRQRAYRLAREHRWTVGRDGHGFRRLVASPEPLRILQLASIRRLADAGAVVICGGGGGVPVAIDERGALSGTEAVVDKDFVSARLALEVEADALLLLTDVDAAFVGWGAPEARAIRRGGPGSLRSLEFERGSMGPKIDAACRFIEEGGRFAAIGALENAGAVMRGDAGTRIDGEARRLTFWSSRGHGPEYPSARR